MGDRLLHLLLTELDPEFPGLFKVAVDFEDHAPRADGGEMRLARLVAGIIRDEKLRPFERDAVARVVEQAARLADDGEKVTTRVRDIADLVRETDHAAAAAGHPVARAADVQAALDAADRRRDRIRRRTQQAIFEGTLLVDTAGTQVGQVNGLSVVQLGGWSFGRPSRITARVRLGRGEVVDIEREVELGGPIHSKGVLILAGFLGGRFAPDRPLSLRASLVFEQSYGGVEGDSASSAELYALLSALAELPVRQGIAVTGSVNQHGRVQAIGGVNEKVEGFYDVCRERGLDGTQGVVDARRQPAPPHAAAGRGRGRGRGRFHVWTVEHGRRGHRDPDRRPGRPAARRWRVARGQRERAGGREASRPGGGEQGLLEPGGPSVTIRTARRVVVALDASAPSREAARAAAELARRLGAVEVAGLFVEDVNVLRLGRSAAGAGDPASGRNGTDDRPGNARDGTPGGGVPGATGARAGGLGGAGRLVLRGAARPGDERGPRGHGRDRSPGARRGKLAVHRRPARAPAGGGTVTGARERLPDPPPLTALLERGPVLGPRPACGRSALAGITSVRRSGLPA